MSVLEQLGKHEPRKPPRALEEGDLVRCWSFVHLADSYSEKGGGAGSMEHKADAIAAWETRVRERGWIPAVTVNATREALFIFGHANPSDPGLEQKVAELVGAVNDLNGAQAALSDHVSKLHEAVDRRLHLPGR